MNFEKFTTRSQSIISGAQFFATDAGHTEITTLHLLKSLLKEDQSVMPYVMQQGELALDSLKNAIDAAFAGLPTSDSSAPYMGRDAAFVLQKSEQIAGKMKDEYVATEHLILAMIEDKGTVGKMLADMGFTRNLVERAIDSLR